MNSILEKKFRDIEAMVGNTPLLKIHYEYKGKANSVFAKAEYYNLTGSIKDRPAISCLKRAYERQEIKPTDIITEATSGNAGISFCAIGAYLGHTMVIYMSDWMSHERISLMESYGAKVELVSKQQGGFLGSIEMTKRLWEQGGVFLPRQFENPDNTLAHYETTGLEIVRQLEKIGLIPDCIVAGVGTGGTVAGIGRRLKEANPQSKTIALEPESSPTMSTGCKVGTHRIAGISDEFVPQIIKDNPVDGIIQVDDGDSINMARLLCAKLGLGVGISSGANLLGAIKEKEELGGQSVITTVFSDDNKKYLTTDYAFAQPEKEGFITPYVKLIGFETIL